MNMLGLNSIPCPYCLRDIDKSAYRCSNPVCNRDVDPSYVNHYSNHPAFFVPLLGLTGVGKTVYLQTLMLTLRQINRLWSDSSSVPVDQKTASYIKRTMRMYDAKRIPDMTQDDEVYMMYLQNVLPWRDLTIIFRDLPGENYRDFTFSDDVTRFLSERPILFMMLPLSEVLSCQYNVDELICNYIHTERSLSNRILQKPKHIIIILSQADKVNMAEMPGSIRTYLYDDDVWNRLKSKSPPVHSTTFITSYLRKVRVNSQKISKELRHELSPINALASHEKIKLHYCVVSSLGRPLTGGALTGPIHPYRVLDPLLLALGLGGEKKQ